MSEETYFFKLSKYRTQLIKFVEKYIVPKSKRNEILTRLKSEELRDLCVARKNLDWGIDTPIDKEFKIYVWFDALINYVTGANGNWPADVHVIGKGINWFHSVIWPAILMSAGIKLPKTLLVHGYLNLSGKKISKTLGNTIDPIELAEKYGSDSVRYSILRCSVFEDSDYSEEILIERHNNELANKLGNLVSRVSTLAEKYGVTKCENKLLKKFKIKPIEKNLDNFELDKALAGIFSFIDVCNEYVQNKKPWETQDKKVLYELVESIKVIAKYLSVYIPETSEKISKVFGARKIKKAPVLFKKIEVVEAKENKQKINKLEKQRNIEGIITMTNVQFGEWEKIELVVGEIEKVEDIEGADKLYKLSVDIGEEMRTICAGIKQYYSKADLKGKKIILFKNLEPRKMKGIESQGMLLAAVSEDSKQVVLISPESDIKVGSRVS